MSSSEDSSLLTPPAAPAPTPAPVVEEPQQPVTVTSSTSSSTGTSKSKSKSKEASSASAGYGEQARVYLTAFASSLPPNLKPHVERGIPLLVQGADTLEKHVIPNLLHLYTLLNHLHTQLAPYHPELLLPSIIGLVMCFFGGSFMTLIAAVEAYRLVGWESSRKCLEDLYADFQKVVDANKKDDVKDEDEDGVPDVLQVDGKTLLTRKTLLFLKTVDPHRFSGAISGLQSAFLAVLATLKIKFAKAITLGNSIAEIVEKPVFKYALPLLEKLLPPEYRRWAQPVLQYAIKSVAVSIAWTLQRIISAFHSAMAGGVMASRNVIEYLNVMKIIEFDHNQSMLDEVAGYGLALLGLIFQLSMGFQLPFLLKLLLLPFTLAEWLLLAMVNRM